MIAVHDLAEAIVGDVPAFEKSRRQNNKRSNEANALRKMVSRLDSNPLREEIVSLWEEFELGKSAEAKFAKALDKVEVLIQHNITDISTWEDGDYKLNPYYSNDKFDFDQFMRLFKDIVDEDTMAKVESNNKLTRVSGKHRKVWRDSKII
jgi:putative hydrolase of HD superfamily